VAEAVAVTVEFYGVPRLRAGRAELALQAATVGEALRAVVSTCPRLGDLIGREGRLAGHYLLSLDGRRFVTELGQPLQKGDRLLVLSADSGG